MNEQTFDSLTRRASLVTLGAAGLAALARPLTAEVKKNKKKNKSAKKAKKQCQQDLAGCTSQATICAGQVAPCTTTLANQCETDPACADQAAACCQYLATCDVTTFFACLVTSGLS